MLHRWRVVRCLTIWTRASPPAANAVPCRGCGLTATAELREGRPHSQPDCGWGDRSKPSLTSAAPNIPPGLRRGRGTAANRECQPVIAAQWFLRCYLITHKNKNARSRSMLPVIIDIIVSFVSIVTVTYKLLPTSWYLLIFCYWWLVFWIFRVLCCPGWSLFYAWMPENQFDSSQNSYTVLVLLLKSLFWIINAV